MGCGDRRQTFKFGLAGAFAIVVRLTELNDRGKIDSTGDYITDTG
jgi:hypothetical protein